MEKIKIVHLDDHSLYQYGVQMCIDPQKNRFFIVKLQHPDDALRYMKNSFENRCKIDLIITDLSHPGMDGYEFALEVRRLEKLHGKYIPIILLSMHVSPLADFTKRWFDEGVFDYCLSKNAEGSEMLFGIDLLLNKEKKDKPEE